MYAGKVLPAVMLSVGGGKEKISSFHHICIRIQHDSFVAPTKENTPYSLSFPSWSFIVAVPQETYEISTNVASSIGKR